MELDAGIAVQIGDIVKGHTDKLHKRMDDMPKTPKPTRRSFGGSGVAVAATILNVPCFPVCQAGRMWVIRSVGIFGNDAHTVVAGAIADIFGGPLQEQNIPDFTSVILNALPVPTVKDFGNRHQTLYNQEQVYALVTGAAANQQIVVAGEADEYILDEVEEVIIKARKLVDQR